MRPTAAGAAAAALAFCALAEEPGWKALPEITLRADALPGQCVTVPAVGGAGLLPCDGTAFQRFRAPGPDGGVLRYGDKCMSVMDEGASPGLFVVTCGNGGDHYWIVDHKGRLANNAGRCLAYDAARTRLYGAHCGETLQTWSFLPVSAP